MTEPSPFPRARNRLRAANDGDRRFALLLAMMIARGRGRRDRSGWVEGRELAMDNERPVVTEANKDRIRAGVSGHNVRLVLILGLALVVIAYIIIAYVVK